MSGPVTISDLMRDRRLLWANAGAERDVDPATLPLPSNYPVPEVAKRMRCSAATPAQQQFSWELLPFGAG